MEHSLCFSFSSILFHSCARCSCAAPAHPRCVCGTCPKRHLPSALSPVCPLPTFTQQSFLPVLVLPQESQWHCRLSWSCYQICLGFLGLLSQPLLVLGMTCRHLQPHFIVFCRVLPQSTPFPRHMQTSWQCFMSHSFWWVFFIISLFCPYLFICSLLVLQGAFFGAKIIFLFCVFTLFLTFCWLVFTLFLPFWFAWPMRSF